MTLLGTLPTLACFGATKRGCTTIQIIRVIPGFHQVTVEWLPPPISARVAAYLVETKLRGADWENAVRVCIGRRARAATLKGLLNYADYAIRVIALDADGRQLGTSAERLVTPAWVPGTVVDYLHRDDETLAERGRFIGSPSIARLEEGALVASHDLFGPGPQNYTRIFRSDDGGKNWRWLTDIVPAFWGKLFVHRGALYLLATRTEYGDLLLYRSQDGGVSWTEPAIVASGAYHKAPVPVIEHNGRLWTCVEVQMGAWPSGFQAVACSVPAMSDLMEGDNWSVGLPLPYDPAWLPAGWAVDRRDQGYLEGNVIVAPDGRLLNVLRYNTVPHFGKAVVLEINQNDLSLEFDGVIDFPGGMSKFNILWHPRTARYWSLVNRVTIPDKPGMRSVLSLASSRDLFHWVIHHDILRDDSPWAVQYTGFQYVDWLFDGDDILAVCRMAWNGARNFHDANYLTFHRITGFAREGDGAA